MNVRILAIGVALTFTIACSGTSSGTGSSSGGGSGSPSSTAAKACADTADAVAKAAQRCGGDYQQNYQSFLDQAANGSCNNITQIRDESELRSKCIPSFETITCTALQGGAIDASCSKQLVRVATYQPVVAPAGHAEGWAGVGAE